MPKDLQTLINDTISRHLIEARENRLRFRIPASVGSSRMTPTSHYHLTPELFLQISGVTRMALPNERMALYPGDVCLVPGTVPHTETAGRYRGEFLNLVLMFHQGDCLSIHAAVASPQGTPIARDTIYYSSVERIAVQVLMEEIARPVVGRSRHRANVVQSLWVALLCLLVEVVNGKHEEFHELENRHVVFCKRFIQGNLANPALTVELLAEMTSISPDYLSHLFVMETGVRLVTYINRQRIACAQKLLIHSDLNISETAWASGYRDPGYFTRVFRRETGCSPREYKRH